LHKIHKKLGLLLVVFMTVSLLMSVAHINTAGAAGTPAADAVQFLYHDYTTNGIKNSDTGVGSYALYVLTRAGVPVDTWRHNGVSLEEAVISAVTGDLLNAADPSKVSAKLLAQDLAAMKALGQSDLAGQLIQIFKDRQSDTGFDTGDYSLFSNVPAYDLLGRAGAINEINKDQAITYLLGTQNTTDSDPAVYGSWGYLYEGTFYADLMATTGAVRALNCLDPDQSDAQVQNAINNGLDWIQKQQQADGSFMAGMDDR
jgi:hypothetical protein